MKRALSHALALLAIVASLIAAQATPAAATGGGCNNWASNGFNIGVCSGDNGVTLGADLYVNANPGISSCRIVSQVIDYWYSPAKVVKQATYGRCSVGHYGPLNVTGVYGHWYRHHVWVQSSSGSTTYVSGYSPWTSF